MENIKNKNTFIISCIACIALILVMLYFGINSPFKGTSANTECECNEGDERNGTLCLHTEDQSETYDATEEKKCSCPTGYAEDGDRCSMYVAGGNKVYTPKSCETKYTCSRGGRQDGTTCTITKTVTKTYAATCTSESDSDNIPACSTTVINSIGTSCPTETNKTTYVSGGITCNNANCTSHQCNVNGRDATYQVCTYRSPSEKQCTLKYEASCGASFTYTGASTVPSFNDCVISTTHAKYTYTCTNNGKDSDGCIKGSCTVKFAGCDVNYALNSSGECCYCPGCVDSPNAPNPTIPTGGGGPVTPNPSSETPSGGGNPNNPNPSNPSGENPNISENPQTSDILIFIVWVVGLFSICYSLWYYKMAKNNQ